MSDLFVGPPKLKDFVCDVNTDVSKPLCVLNFVLDNDKQMSTKETGEKKDQSDSENTDTYISFTATPSVLETLLEGLHRIQQQLSASSVKSTN